MPGIVQEGQDEGPRKLAAPPTPVQEFQNPVIVDDDPERAVRELFKDDDEDEPMDKVNTDRRAAQFFTNTTCSLKSRPTIMKVYGRSHIMAEANGPLRALNIIGLDVFLSQNLQGLWVAIGFLSEGRLARGRSFD